MRVGFLGVSKVRFWLVILNPNYALVCYTSNAYSGQKKKRPAVRKANRKISQPTATDEKKR
jgi:hypothetical protein